MNKSTMDEIHRALGAVIEMRNGAEEVRSYGDPVSEHRAVRSRAGLIDQSYRGKIRLTGRDRVDFLHGMVTNDIKKLGPGNGLYAAFTNDKARMLSDARIYCLPDGFWIDTEPEAAQNIQKHLDKYTLASDVTVENVTGVFGLLSIHGPASLEILLQAFGSESLPAQEYSTASLSLDGVPILVARNEITAEMGFDLIIPTDRVSRIWDRIFEAGSSRGLQPIGAEALDSLRIEAGIPRYRVDMDESNFPMETGLEKTAISYTKGCYIGQETIARADAQGRMNKHLVGLEMGGDSVPKRGQPIQAPRPAYGTETKSVGVVTSAVKSPSLGKVIALGYVHRDFVEPGSELEIDGIAARVKPLPFYRSGDPGKG